jgi:chromosomal replication initiation ATPase DnaA
MIQLTPIVDLMPLRGHEFLEAVTLRVAKAHGLPVAEVKSARRFKGLAMARFEAWFLIYSTGRFSTVQIAQFFGRDHSSVVHGLNRFREILNPRKAA